MKEICGECTAKNECDQKPTWDDSCSGFTNMPLGAAPERKGKEMSKHTEPELLEALKMVVRYLEHSDVLVVMNLMALLGDVLVKRIQETIAAAEGVTP